MIRKKILVVDDEEDFCLLLKAFFQEKGMDVFVAYTLNTGLKCMKKHKPDVLFLDNNLPDGLGWTVITRIIDQYPSTKINLISAHTNREYRHLIGPAIRFWEKPINPEELNRYVP
jgi:DNA-binding response OmpR family regulator